ncbi:MAG: PAS domain S-box protein [Candidatus Hodarchaeales archaeon]|jgi:PAS domain S-box-containing protein
MSTEKNHQTTKPEGFYKDLVNNSRDVIFTIDLKGKLTSINPAIEKYTNWRVEEWLNSDFTHRIHPDDLPSVLQGYTNIIRGKTAESLEVRILTKSGNYHPFEIKGSPQIKDMKITGLLGFAHSLQEIRASERRYRTLIQTAMEGVWVTDLENKTTYVNPALEKMLGWSSEEMMGREVVEYLREDSLEQFDLISKERYEDHIPSSTYELTFLNKEKKPVITRVTGTALYDRNNNVSGSFGLLTDVTSEKEAQERYRKLIEFNPDAIILTDLNFTIIKVNEQALVLNGANSPEELLGRNAIEFIAPEDRQFAIANAKKTLDEGKTFTFEYSLLRLDGTSFPGELIVSTIEDDEGNPEAFIAITRDITERKIAEAKLIESERNYRTLVENLNSGIFRVSRQGRLIQANRAFIEMFGYSSVDEITSLSLSTLYANAEDRGGFVEELYESGEITIMEVLMAKKDGSNFWAWISAKVSPNGQWHDGIIENITTRKRAETKLLQVKLEEERYHAMMSHFIRNDLQKIVSSLEYILLEEPVEYVSSKSRIEEIIKVSTRSSKTIEKVTLIFEVLQSGFILDETTEPERVDILEYFKEITRRFESDKIKFQVITPSYSLMNEKYLPIAIQELILFLIDSNGDLSSNESSIRIDSSFIDQNLIINISDNTSTPIPSAISKRLTAKITERWESHGFYVGITLASVIMQYFKGNLTINPQPNHGNKFTLSLPKTLVKFS